MGATTAWGKKERKKTDNPREGWEDGTPPPHRDFKDFAKARGRWSTILSAFERRAQ